MKKYRAYLIAAAVILGFLIFGFFLSPSEQQPESVMPTAAATIPAVETETPSPTETQTPENTETPVPTASATAAAAATTLAPTAVPTAAPTETPQKTTCTVSISCASVLSHSDQLDPAKKDLIPSGGTILSAETVGFSEGESAFDVLKRETKKHKIHMEFSLTPVTKSAYIEGIGNLYEFDAGELSGWMYRVNGEFPSHGASNYILKNGDRVEWLYTCDLGRDIGAGFGGQRDE